MARALVALGSNLGDRAIALTAAASAIGKLPATQLLANSSWIESAAVGGPPDQPSFLNGAVLVQTPLAPRDLIDRLQQIETAGGRSRDVRWGPRTLDLDLLLYDDLVVHTEQLDLPHPRMAFRRFVLEPAAQIAPQMLHPTTGRTVAQLLANLNITPPYLALLGPPACGKTALAMELAAKTGSRLILDPPANSAGPRTTREIEFLTRRARLLGSLSGEVWTVSDFWLPQSLAWAEAEAGAALRLEVEDALRQVEGAGMSARFVAALDLSAAVVVTPNQHQDNDLDSRLRAAMRRLLMEPGGPPAIWLSGGDWQEAVTELLAVLAG
ncbi:MAG TPA: 2-amino-4-hydroxy-6-hydroxymethyldihydropteridine diphosphokinase [Pirellulales bacterium]|nr:2-amino-4-hydroxy-6-hydroxymethyldihydropteridine diphosphokinase [Pirellulales bacterium]